eukprot:CAMPEP_0194716656 /NCGR_PEP_ID=MMETSP0296-20130528/8350_1 /TAXON_ID=39354 /ORGANISM="Heterosigma akashiwo, Strain CCMP2393" /LENGTH=182 /DNA_ID=CAMNT_0039617149 /DNA_START=54 /DNA_END=598 /DNA_ORIENTATION=+
MIVYFDCFSGAAGDMLLASLIDAGAPLDKLKQGLESIRGIQGEWELVTTRVSRSEGHIAALHVKVESAYDNRPAPAPGSKRIAHDHHHNHAHETNKEKPKLRQELQHAGQGHNHSHRHSHDHNERRPRADTIQVGDLARNSNRGAASRTAMPAHTHSHTHPCVPAGGFWLGPLGVHAEEQPP